MSLDLFNKKYLVVGASSGIGRAIAILISKLNGKVVLLSLIHISEPTRRS